MKSTDLGILYKLLSEQFGYHSFIRINEKLGRRNEYSASVIQLLDPTRILEVTCNTFTKSTEVIKTRNLLI